MTTQIISRTLDAAYSLCYKQGFLFYAGKDQEATTDETVATTPEAVSAETTEEETGAEDSNDSETEEKITETPVEDT